MTTAIHSAKDVANAIMDFELFTRNPNSLAGTFEGELLDIIGPLGLPPDNNSENTRMTADDYLALYTALDNIRMELPLKPKHQIALEKSSQCLNYLANFLESDASSFQSTITNRQLSLRRGDLPDDQREELTENKEHEEQIYRRMMKAAQKMRTELPALFTELNHALSHEQTSAIDRS